MVSAWRMVLHCVSGALLAVLASDALAWGRSWDSAQARGPLALAAILAAAILGRVAASSLGRRASAAVLRDAVAILLCAAPPAWRIHEFWNWPGRLGDLTRIYVSSLVFCTTLSLLSRPLTWLDRRAARARSCTPIREIDELASWALLTPLGIVAG